MKTVILTFVMLAAFVECSWAEFFMPVGIDEGRQLEATVRYSGTGSVSVRSLADGPLLDLKTTVKLRDGRSWWGGLVLSFERPVVVEGHQKITFELKSGTDRRIHTLGIVVYNDKNIKLEPSYINFSKKWTTYEYHLGHLRCNAVSRIDFIHMASGFIPGEDSSEEYLIRNIKIVQDPAVVPDGWHLAWGASGFNRIGYLPGEDKHIVISSEEHGPFDVVSGNGVVLERLIGEQGMHGNTVVDVTAIRIPGLYQLESGGRELVRFKVIEDRANILDLVIRSFEYMMSGVAVVKEEPFGHEASHLDNCKTMIPQVLSPKLWSSAKANLKSVGKRMDLVGGWYDAGIVDQYVENTAMITYAMASAFLADGNQTRALSQASWGADWLVKTVLPTNELVYYTCKQTRWTDNVVGNGDDRYADVRGTWPEKAMMTVSALVKYAQCLASSGEPTGSYAKVASAVFEHYDKYINRTFYKSMSMTNLYALLAATELYELTGDDHYKRSARQYAGRLLKMQSGEPYYYFNRTTSRQKMFRSLDGQCFIAFSLMRYCQVFEDTAEAEKAVSRWLEKYLVPSFEPSGEFGIPAFGLYNGRNADDKGEWWGTGWDPNIFAFEMDATPASSKSKFSVFGRHQSGNNRLLLSSMLVLNQAEKVFNQPKYGKLSESTRQWLLGKNPYSAVMVRGATEPDMPVYSIMLGQIPGMFIKGIGSFDGDTPFLSPNINYPQKEIWGVVGALFILAESKVQ